MSIADTVCFFTSPMMANFDQHGMPCGGSNAGVYNEMRTMQLSGDHSKVSDNLKGKCIILCDTTRLHDVLPC